MERKAIRYSITKVEELDRSKINIIQEFLNAASNATAFHDINLNIYIARFFVIQTSIIIAYKDNIIQGLLLYNASKIDSVLTSPYQLSLCTYGGPITRSDDNIVALGLLRIFKRQCRKGSIYIKSSYKTPSELYRRAGFRIQLIPTLLIPLGSSENEIWENIDNRIKRNIKKAWKSNLKISWDNGDSIDQLTEIYKGLCEHKGLFFHGTDYYKNVCSILQCDSKMSIFYASIDGEIISAMSVLEFKDTINPWFGGTKREHMETGAGSLIYWEILKYGRTKGYKTFDFLGLDIGPIAFYKKGFGGYMENVCHASYSPLVLRILRNLSSILKQ